ncbi:MAG: hypothetical protein WD875_06470 [Pirellulales bacterium]
MAILTAFLPLPQLLVHRKLELGHATLYPPTKIGESEHESDEDVPECSDGESTAIMLAADGAVRRQLALPFSDN